MRARCTSNRQKGREIARGVDEHHLHAADARFTKEMARIRKCSAEHPFGTIKRIWHQGSFLTRGLKGVNTEIHLSALAYNMRRAISLLGVAGALEAMA